MSGVTLIGCGCVADLYMRSLQASGIAVLGAYDLRAERLQAFCAYWDVPQAKSRDALFAVTP